ncbi:MAG: glycosyltransferase family 4 protein [Cryobacterium sp.]|nr:glycosyltransferase family 4 protein [Cryobacterium sp.]
MTKVLVITGDPIGARMAGPAIRAWNIADVLAKEHEVILMTSTRLDQNMKAEFQLLELKPGQNREFRKLETWADVIVFQGHAMSQFQALQTTSKVVVADIYDPMHLEMLEQGRELPMATWELRVSNATRVLNQQMERADFFLCSSERQRSFFLGQLAAIGRINPMTYRNDPHLRKLIDVAPFGLDSTPPTHARAVLRGVVDGIGLNDKILIWGGGLYSWFDPKTLIRAVTQLSMSRPEIRLYFLGTRHPGVERMGIVSESLKLARELNALNSSVFFNEEWVPFADRQNFLLEADIGVSTHHSHLETTYSFRTRILDYLWAGLPMVVTSGDSFAELVEGEKLGIVVPEEDVDALASAIDRALFDRVFQASVRANVQRVAEQFTWENTLQPLIEFVRAPQRAADASRLKPPLTVKSEMSKPYGLRHDAGMAWHYFRNAGSRVTFQKLLRRLKKRQ